MAKKLTKKAAKSAATETPESHVVDHLSGQVVRVFDLGPLFGLEATTGTIHPFAKDRVAKFFRRSGRDVHFSDRGFDRAPEDSLSYCTIEEIEELCTEVTEAEREQAKEALNEEVAESGDKGKSSQIGDLQAPQRD